MMNKRVCLIAALSAIACSAMPSAPDHAKGADRLVADVETYAKSMKGFSCDSVAVRHFPATKNRPAETISENVTVTFLHPNYIIATSKDSNEDRTNKYQSDGKKMYYIGKAAYNQGPIDRTSEEWHWFHNDLFLLYVTGSFDKAIEAPHPPTKKLLPDETWEGNNYHVVEADVVGGYPISYKLYIGDDNVVHRIIHTEFDGGRPFVLDFSVSNFKANPDMTPADFKFKPAPGMVAQGGNLPQETPLIAIGATAPAIALPTPEGPRISLSEALAGKKALLITFWFVHCPPCRAEHPKLDLFYEEMKDKGLGVLAIDDQDSAASVAKYMKEAGLHFTTVLSGPMAAINPKTGYPDYRGPKLPDYASLVPFGIHWCPTNILLDSNGKVVYEADAWDEMGLRNALESLGVK
ncbi:MAG TPA: TlpA disulfide reductase family protein [Fimbriimonadaceae bacterium]|jgi:peroxiredoxin/outer membrane lipoprotein-sorting protein